MSEPLSKLLAALPSVDRLLSSAAVAGLLHAHGRKAVTRTIRRALDEKRAGLRSGAITDIDEEHIIETVAKRLDREAQPPLVRVFNLTGTVLHTNLGRAVLPREAIEAVAMVAGGASNLEFDLSEGRRGDRDAHLEAQVCRITGSEAATVVNNNAAAVMLVLNTLAIGKEVPVSRGELVEIGGSFRIPDIMARSGCKLVEVGTTNRTHLKDFAQAIGSETAMIMKVHTSNYIIEGFTAEVAEPELAALCRKHALAFVNDLGSGTLVDLERYGLPHEPTPMDALKNGADVVTFSGDKLLGGPQAGLIVGRKDLIARIKSNPMKRALRCDKMTIAALSAVLRLYEDPDRLTERLPTLRDLTRPAADIRKQAARLLPGLAARLAPGYDVSVCDCASEIGSGALPTRTIASAGLAIRPADARKGSGTALNLLAIALRSLPVPVVGRVSEDTLILDLRCLADEATFAAQLDNLELAS